MTTIREIQNRVCVSSGVTLTEMLGPSRERRFARPRQIAFYLADRLTGRSKCEIARRFYRDHSTVRHGIDAVARARVHDRRMDVTVRSFLRELQA